MKAIIIENETSASRLLSNILEEYCPSIEVLGIAASNKEGFKLIHSRKVDLIFLDIELDDGQSFELLDMIEQKNFKIIFTTAYDQYAIKAFRYDAVDYLLKPYTPKSVVGAVKRVEERQSSTAVFNKLNKLIEKAPSSKKIPLSTSKGIRMCHVENIKRIEAAASYCTVHFMDGEKLLISKPLAELEKSMPAQQFFRVHASHSVNLAHVKAVVNEDGGYIELVDGSQVPLARRRKQEFIEQLK